MKKLALVLGSLLVVATSVSAKEVVAAPVVKVEPVVVAAPVVKAPVAAPVAFKPTGSVYANSELKGSTYDFTKSYNEQNIWSREVVTNLGANINHMPNHSMRVFGENKNFLHSNAYDSTGAVIANGGVTNKVGLGYNYKHGMFAHDLAAEFETGKQSIKYAPSFNWNGWAVKPSHKYIWENGINSAKYANETELSLGYDLNGIYMTPFYKHVQTPGMNNNTDEASLKFGYNVKDVLPMGLTPYIEAKFENKFKTGTDERNVVLAANVNKAFNLMKNDSTSVNFDIKPWYEGRVYTNAANNSAANNSNRWHKLGLNSGLSAEHKFSPNFKMNASLAAEYLNAVIEENRMQDWKVKPTAKLGFTASF